MADTFLGPWLLGLLLLPWMLQLTGEHSVIHTGAPILVSLANKSISFDCQITDPDSSRLKNFTALYFFVDLQNQRSPSEQIKCPPDLGNENQTHTLRCLVTPRLPNASATGTYYCSVVWPEVQKISEGVFILVRDTGYRRPPQGSQQLLLFCFTGVLTVLSILVTALLLWRKKRMQAPQKHPAQTGSDLSAHSQQQPPDESVYMALQHRDTEIYSCIQNEASSLPTTQSLLSQMAVPPASAASRLSQTALAMQDLGSSEQPAALIPWHGAAWEH
ncbi:NFAT activation molecule 1 isoform X1 [Mirounga leonina]|uniref:NFAT activation molecule 1 isoform X1 n=1 Tax=Mirounga leonina TaxID=9715 RepID=UPI00156BDDC7|nr:NFAT activation molecule 1 isoform X1 [Mirounga leonina]